MTKSLLLIIDNVTVIINVDSFYVVKIFILATKQAKNCL